MKLILSLVVLLFSSRGHATEPSLPLKQVGVLKGATSTPAEVKKTVASQIPTLQKMLNTDNRTYRITFKEGDAKDILNGAITFKELPAKEVDFIWDHSQVTASSEGPAFQVRVPLIAKKSYGIVQEDRFLVKLVPQMGSTAGTRNAAGSTVVSAYRFQFSEVEASALTFFVAREGTVFAIEGEP